MDTRDEVPICQKSLLLWDQSRHLLCAVALIGCLPSVHSTPSQTTFFFCKRPPLSPLLTLGETHLVIPSVDGTSSSGKWALFSSASPSPLPAFPPSLFPLLLFKSLFPRPHVPQQLIPPRTPAPSPAWARLLLHPASTAPCTHCP